MKTYKTNAVIIGALFIFTMLAGMIDAYFVAPLFKNPVGTILQMDNKILLGVFSVLIMAVGIVFIAITIYPVIKKQSETIALTYVILRTIEGFLLILGSVCYLYIIALDGNPNNDVANLAVNIALSVKIKYYGYQLAMVILGFGSLFLCYSLYESRIVPRFVAIWGGIGYLFLFLSAVLELCGLIDTTKGLGAIMYVPGGLWEIVVFPFWLFIKGFDLSFLENRR